MSVAQYLAARLALLAGLMTAAALPAHAHQASTAYLDMNWQGTEVNQRVDVALRDLDRDLVLDRNDDGQLSWGEVRQAWPEIEALLTRHVHWQATGARCEPVAAPQPQLAAHGDGQYVVVQTQWRCDAPVQAIQLHYDLFQQTDPDHRALLQVNGTDASNQARAITPGAEAIELVSAAAGSGAAASTGGLSWPALGDMVEQGVHHILIGTDHILFLLALLLPAVLSWRAATGRVDASTPPDRLRTVAVRVFKIVTAFTVAHSVTLALATFNIVSPPTRLVESIIALSIIVAAVSNLFRRGHVPGVAMAFCFGLMHGFGFANALGELALQQGQLAANLLAPNVGVESGQLMIVLGVMPLLWLVRRHATASRWVLQGGSVVIAVMGGVWLAERTLEIQILPV